VVVITKPETFEEYDARWHAEQAAAEQAKRLFNKDAMARFVAAVGKEPLHGREALAEDLELARTRYLFRAGLDDQPPPGETEKWFADVVRHLMRLRKLFSHPPGENRDWLERRIFLAGLDRHDPAQVRCGVEAIPMLEAVFGEILRSKSFGLDQLGPRLAAAWLIGGDLPETYEKHFGEKLRWSRDTETGMPRGPGIDFLVKSLSIMGVVNRDGKPFGAEAVEYYLRKRSGESPR
jgi:hypothetical protein